MLHCDIVGTVSSNTSWGLDLSPRLAGYFFACHFPSAFLCLRELLRTQDRNIRIADIQVSYRGYSENKADKVIAAQYSINSLLQHLLRFGFKARKSAGFFFACSNIR